MKLKTTISVIFTSLIILQNTVGQADWDDPLFADQDTAPEYATATFKSTRILNSQSIERMPAKQLDVRIHHRFNKISTGAYNFWGLDGAETHIGLEYGFTDYIMAGIGRGNNEKTFDGFVKLSLWRQCSGKKNMPVSISWFSSAALRSLDFPYVDSIRNNSNYPFSSRMAYVHQILLARKFNKYFSLQLSPTMLHYNLVGEAIDPNNMFACGIGGRMKLTTRISFNAEYFYLFQPGNMASNYNNNLSLGFDIETGGHVFQFVFSNSQGIIEKDFIGRSVDKWSKGDIYFGFNISRVFSFKHK